MAIPSKPITLAATAPSTEVKIFSRCSRKPMSGGRSMWDPLGCQGNARRVSALARGHGADHEGLVDVRTELGGAGAGGATAGQRHVATVVGSAAAGLVVPPAGHASLDEILRSAAGPVTLRHGRGRGGAASSRRGRRWADPA